MRRLSLFVLALALLAIPSTALAQDDDPVVDVVQVSGIIDDSLIDFVVGRIEAARDRGAEAVVLQLSSRATVSGDLLELISAMQASEVPLVVWIGPQPAIAQGGAVAILAAADVRAAAPGVRVGNAAQIQAGGARVSAPDDVADGLLTVGEGPISVVDLVTPSIANLFVELDGSPRPGGPEDAVFRTVVRDGAEVTPVQAVFWEPGIGTRTLRLAVSPEAVFFFLVMGLMVAAFEFYAIGPGIAAGVAAASLLISSYGLVTLPIRWWAVALVVVALWLMTVDYQRGGTGPLTWLGGALLFVSGLFITDAAPQLVPNWVAVLAVVVAALLWYLVAMTTVARSRFSTPTIGREHMIGRRGVAVSEFGPLGEVEVDGARWSATAHREAGLAVGSPVEVVGVDGRFLEVEPVEGD